MTSGLRIYEHSIFNNMGRIKLSKKEKIEISKRMTGNKIWCGRKHSDETRAKLKEIALMDGRKPPGFLGKKLSLEHCENIRKSKLGSNNPNFGKKRSIKTRKKMSKAQRGNKSWNWQGGKELEMKIIRHSVESKIWREKVFERDNYICQKTGVKGVILHPHHIKNFSDYPELRFKVDNGITLSKKAHKEFHKKYGFKDNTKKQLNEFLNENSQKQT